MIVCRINVNVWDGVELRESVFVEIDVAVVVELIESVGVVVCDLDCWIVLVTELVNLEVPVIFIEPDSVPEAVIVFDWVTEPDTVVVPVEVLELDELPENVEVPVGVLDCAGERVNEAEPVIIAVWEELFVRPGGPDLVAETDPVIECVLEPRTVAETHEEAVEVLLPILVLVEVEVTEDERVILLTVKVGLKESINELVILDDFVEQELDLGVLVDLKLWVSVLLLPILGVWVVVPVSVFEAARVFDKVGEAEEVLLEVIVLVPLEEPDEVLVAVIVEVPVLEFRIVLVWRGDLEIEVEAVEVREPREERVVDGEAEAVFDTATVLELVGLDEPVLDWVAVPVWVLEEVWVLDVVVVPVIVLEDDDESVNLDVDEEVLVISEVLVNCCVGFIVSDENLEGVGLKVGLDE